jgi:hypothetical protein
MVTDEAYSANLNNSVEFGAAILVWQHRCQGGDAEPGDDISCPGYGSKVPGGSKE